MIAVINTSGIAARMEQDVLPVVWEKLCVNVGINALTALLRVNNGSLLQSDDARSILTDAVKEAHCVAARVLSRQLGKHEAAITPLVAAGWEVIVEKALTVAASTAGNRSRCSVYVLYCASMLTDIATSLLALLVQKYNCWHQRRCKQMQTTEELQHVDRHSD